MQASIDQEQECFRIVTASNHYEVLQLEVKVAEADIVRKQYRRIALRVHPDKNPSPDAEQAFKIISTAYDCLCDVVAQQDYLDELTHGRHRKQFEPSSSAASAHTHGQKAKFTPARKWWEHKSWADVEKEIKKQEAAWQDHIAQEVAEYEERKEMKSAYRKRRRTRVHQRLAPLYAKYGLEDEYSERHDEMRQEAKESSQAAYSKRNERRLQGQQQQQQHSYQNVTAPQEVNKGIGAPPLALCSGTTASVSSMSSSLYNDLPHVQSVRQQQQQYNTDLVTVEKSNMDDRSSISGDGVSNKNKSHSGTLSTAAPLPPTTEQTSRPSTQSQPVLCTLCNRKFRDQDHLQEHVQFSKLHQSNMEKYMQQPASGN